jgi:hypothetical protein
MRPRWRRLSLQVGSRFSLRVTEARVAVFLHCFLLTPSFAGCIWSDRHVICGECSCQ